MAPRSLVASHPRLRLLSLIAAAGLALAPAAAEACAACACGDPTLTTFGAEQPFEGRVRVASLVRAWGYTETTTGAELGELRVDLAAAWSPLDWLTVSALLPLQGRRGFGVTPGTSLGLGDVTLVGRAMLWRDRPFASRWMVEALVGSVLPTAVGRSSGGLDLPVTSPLSLGEGAFSPLAGLSVLTIHGAWSAHASATGALSFGEHAAGPALRTSLFGQRQLWPFLALRLGAEARLDSPGAATAVHASGSPLALFKDLGQGATVRPAHAGHEHPDGSRPLGLLSFAGLDALFSLSTDTQLQVGVRLPLVTLGSDRPWPIVQAGFVADL